MTLKDLIAEGRELLQDGTQNELGQFSVDNLAQLLDAVERLERAETALLMFDQIVDMNGEDYVRAQLNKFPVAKFSWIFMKAYKEHKALKAREALNPKEGK